MRSLKIISPTLSLLVIAENAKHGADLDSDLAFHPPSRAEVAGGAHVNDQHQGELALLVEHLDERGARSGP